MSTNNVMIENCNSTKRLVRGMGYWLKIFIADWIDVCFIGVMTMLFKCEWFDIMSNINTRVHSHFNLVDVNHTRKSNKYELFALSVETCQVWYVSYPFLRCDRHK